MDLQEIASTRVSDIIDLAREHYHSRQQKEKAIAVDKTVMYEVKKHGVTIGWGYSKDSATEHADKSNAEIWRIQGGKKQCIRQQRLL